MSPSDRCEATLCARIFGDPLLRAASIRFWFPSVRMREFGLRVRRSAHVVGQIGQLVEDGVGPELADCLDQPIAIEEIAQDRLCTEPVQQFDLVG